MKRGRLTSLLKLHAQKRAMERLGVKMTFLDLKRLSKTVRLGRFLQNRKDMQIWRIPFEGREVDVVFDPDRNMIVTFLPLRTVGGGAALPPSPLPRGELGEVAHGKVGQ